MRTFVVLLAWYFLICNGGPDDTIRVGPYLYETDCIAGQARVWNYTRWTIVRGCENA